MFIKSKPKPSIDSEQYEYIKKATKRIKTKKRLYYHFIIFVLTSLFLITIDEVFNYSEVFFKNWVLLVVIVWGFLWVYHAVFVFILQPFLGKNWEKQQMSKLIYSQKERIKKMKAKLEKQNQEVVQSDTVEEKIEDEVFSKKTDKE